MEGDANSTKAVRRYGFVIDTTMCFGCQACVLACKVENNVSDGIRWNNLLTDGGDSPNTPGGTYPDTLHRLYYPVACQHCENPACVKVCPVGATYKDPETGAVRQDYDKCIGCRMCMSACPYTGVRSFNWEEPRPRAPEARCGEVHYVLPPSCARGRACLRQCMQDLRAPLGGS